MNCKALLFTTFIIFLFGKNIFADEIQIESSKVEVSKEGNIIKAINIKANIEVDNG